MATIVFASGGFASSIATGGISLIAIITVSLLIQGWMKHKDVDLKIQNCTHAYQSYQHLLNEIKEMMRSNFIITDTINNKIKESEEKSIQAVNQENVFKKVMDDDEFKEDDDDIHKIGVQNKDFHSVNKKTYEFKIDYDSSLGYYSTRLSIDLIYFLSENSIHLTFIIP